MKFTIGKRLFGQQIRVARAFGNSHPVTLSASPLGLEISAFNDAAILTRRVPAGVSAAGSVSIDTDALHDALAGPKTRDLVTFEANSEHGDAAMAACRLLDGGKAVALGQAWTGRSDHPHAQLGDQLEARLEMPAAELAAVIAETAIAVSTDPLRRHMTGLFIESHDRRLRMVATDGHRMAIRDTDIPLAESALPENPFNGPGAILPLKPVRALERLLKGGGPAVMEIWSAGARFRCRTGEIATKFPDLTFPDYRRVMPAGRMKSTPLDLFMLATAVKAARSSPRSANRWPKITLNGNVTLTPYCDTRKLDAEETLLPVKCRVRGDPISFNGLHLEQAGRAFGQVDTVMRYTKPDYPAVFVSPDRPELTIVQMPACV